MNTGLKIETSSFGRMVIAGKEYSSDLMIYPDGNVEDNWWRERGHSLSLDDIHGIVNSEPEVLVVGMGVNGLMKPEMGLEKKLAEKGVELITLPNDKAMGIFNDLSSKRRVAACFHLTC